MTTTLRACRLSVLGTLLVLLLAPAAHGACAIDVHGGVGLLKEPNATSPEIARVPARSCRLVIDFEGCSKVKAGWCRAQYNGMFGWVQTREFVKSSSNEERYLNHQVLSAVYNVLLTRSERGYNLVKSYSQDLNYGQEGSIKAFYYENDVGWKYPGNPNQTMCVAAVAEALAEALVIYSVEFADNSVYRKLPAIHFSAQGGAAKYLRAHIWEYSGLDSKGAAHALERFNIGIQKKWSQLVPGDFIKFSRGRTTTGKQLPGHSAVFISYVDSEGKILESFGSGAVGFKYFSAQGSDFDKEGKMLKAGFSFRTEYFERKCAALASVPEHLCSVIGPEGRYGVNVGSALSPKYWGEVGSNYKRELAEKIYLERTGAPIRKDVTRFQNSVKGSWLKNAVQRQLDEPLDPVTFPSFPDVQ